MGKNINLNKIVLFLYVNLFLFMKKLVYNKTIEL